MSIRRKRKRYRGAHRYGEQNLHPSAKLTFDQARYVKAAPVAVKELARQFGICPKTVREIRNGVTWRWL